MPVRVQIDVLFDRVMLKSTRWLVGNMNSYEMNVVLFNLLEI